MPAEVSHDLFLPPATAAAVRREIRRARGNEVCFLLSLDEGGALVEPRVVARGHATAVLATIRAPEGGGVVLHNHPSGMVEPSDADLRVAAQLWEQGLGFAITDNAAAELYVVVEPPAEPGSDPIDLDEIDSVLAPDGVLARWHPRYEDRPQQRDLARLIGGLYNDGGIGIAEAGTGTGKSVAYLVPAIRWALRNRERTVVSTNTINLQEQLAEKDLPFLRRALGEPFKFALVKGRRNYVSIRRALLAREAAPTLLDGARQAELASIVEWMERSEDGSLSDLSFRPSAEVWDEVASESDVCLRAKCPHFESCFYQRARREASSADVLVVNHHLLFSDLAVRQSQGNWSAPAVLPAYQRLILDEAHNLEEAATAHLGSVVSRRGLFRTLRRLEHRGKGVLPAFRKALSAIGDDLLTATAVEILDARLFPATEAARQRASDLFGFLEELLVSSGVPMIRWEGDLVADQAWGETFSIALDGLLDHLRTLLAGLEVMRERVSLDERLKSALESQLMELRGAGNRISAAADALAVALRPGEEPVKMVRWIDREAARDGRDANVTVYAAPLDLSEVLRDALFEKTTTAVLTSATLATRGSFDFVRSRLGLWPGDRNAVEEAIFASPFDFARQAMLLVPTDLPLPRGEFDPLHDSATVDAVVAHAEAADGGVFVLFTSYRALRAVAEELRRRKTDVRWPLFVHGEAPRGQLVERFTASGRGILLGTTSFWEGVDVPGDPLRGLVIPKLPFKVPTEPVTAARIEDLEARGENSFTEYMLPAAAIRLKQGFGRLIRSTADHGVVLVLDGRLARKSYGRYFLESLPPVPVRAAPWAEVRGDLARFYEERAVRRAG